MGKDTVSQGAVVGKDKAVDGLVEDGCIFLGITIICWDKLGSDVFIVYLAVLLNIATSANIGYVCENHQTQYIITLPSVGCIRVRGR